MAKDLKNKVVVITGGAVGLGLEVADKYLEKGAKAVVLLDLNEQQGVESAKDLNAKYGNDKAIFIKADVTKDLESSYKKIIDQYKTVDVLINNAGILNDLLLKPTIDINVTALIEWSYKFYDHMRKDKGGKGGTIINLSSIYGYRVDQYLPIYQASKFAVYGFTKSLGHEYNFNRTGVRVYAICPGFTKTNLTADPKTVTDEQLQKDFYGFVKAQAWQQKDAVGRAAVETFENAESGTAWLIEGNRPVEQV